jgi:hypothetical protein
LALCRKSKVPAAKRRTAYFDGRHLEGLSVKTIIMTGETSGLGEIAAHAIGQAPNTRLIIGAWRSAAED